jgi:lipid-binding SYLF domain-containing protein
MGTSCYDVSHGVLQSRCACCAGGGISHDSAANAKKYSAHVTPEDILDGKVDPPRNMEPFYKELQSLTEAGE